MVKRFQPGKDGWNLISSMSISKKYRKNTTTMGGSPLSKTTITWTLYHYIKTNIFVITADFGKMQNDYVMYKGYIDTKAFWHQLWNNMNKFFKTIKEK